MAQNTNDSSGSRGNEPVASCPMQVKTSRFPRHCHKWASGNWVLEQVKRNTCIYVEFSPSKAQKSVVGKCSPTKPNCFWSPGPKRANMLPGRNRSHPQGSPDTHMHTHSRLPENACHGWRAGRNELPQPERQVVRGGPNLTGTNHSSWEAPQSDCKPMLRLLLACLFKISKWV